MRLGKSKIGVARPLTKHRRKAKETERDTARSRGARRAKRGATGCVACGWTVPFLNAGSRSKLLHGHHVVPVAKGGDCSEDNVAVLCPNHHAIAHFIGEAVYLAPVGPDIETAGTRLTRWLKMIDARPAEFVDELALLGYRFSLTTSTVGSTVKHAEIA